MEQLDLIDKRILTSLDENARIPGSTLAKRLRISRQVLDYRMRQLVKRGIILHYTALIDPTAFYSNVWHFYVKLQNCTLAIEEKIMAFLEKTPRVWWIAGCNGEWDLIFSVCGDDIFLLDRFRMQFQSEFHHYLHEIIITTLVSAYVFPRTYFLMTKKKKKVYVEQREMKKIDPKDRAILKVLANEGRIPSTQLGRKVSLSGRQIVHRIRRLEKVGIIRAYRLHLQQKRLGYLYDKVCFYTQDFTEHTEKAIISWCETNPYVVYYLKKVAPWTFEIEFETSDYGVLHHTLKDMKSTFGSFIKRVEIIHINEERKGELNVFD